MIMVAREALKHRSSQLPNPALASSNSRSDAGAADQLAAMQGIARRLDEIIQLMKDKR